LVIDRRERGSDAPKIDSGTTAGVRVSRVELDSNTIDVSKDIVENDRELLRSHGSRHAADEHPEGALAGNVAGKTGTAALLGPVHVVGVDRVPSGTGSVAETVLVGTGRDDQGRDRRGVVQVPVPDGELPFICEKIRIIRTRPFYSFCCDKNLLVGFSYPSGTIRERVNDIEQAD
jgi:hypothetical protein